MALFLRLLACLFCAVQVDGNKLRAAQSKSASKTKGNFEDASLSLLGDHATHVQTMHEFAKLAIEAKRTGGKASAQHMLNVENAIVALYTKRKKVSPMVAEVIKKILEMLEDQMYPLLIKHANESTYELMAARKENQECKDYLRENLTAKEMDWQIIWRQGTWPDKSPPYYPGDVCKEFDDPILTAGSPAIVRRTCGDCAPEWKEIYLRLESAILPFSVPYKHLMETWLNPDVPSLQNFAELFNKDVPDFSLHFTFEDAKSGSNRWTHCEQGVAGEGFPGKCAPNSSHLQPSPQWFTLDAEKEGGKQNIMFEAYTVVQAAENPTRDSLDDLACTLRECVSECCKLNAMTPGAAACGGYCTGTWDEDYGSTHTYRPVTAAPPPPTCMQQCPGTYQKCTEADVACGNWSDIHDCTDINWSPFPDTKVCSRVDFPSYGDYLTAQVDYWARAISDYDEMEAACTKLVGECWQEQTNVCACDESPTTYGQFACVHPEETITPTTTTTTITPPEPFCFNHMDECSRFQRKLDEKACDQTTDRIDECNEYNVCYMEYQLRFGETWRRICYPPNGDRYSIQTEAYGLERVECILKALNHGISIRGQEPAPGGECTNAPKDSCGYYYNAQSENAESSLKICQCPTRASDGLQNWQIDATYTDPGFMCAEACEPGPLRVDFSESPPEMAPWPITGENVRPASQWTPNQKFESQLDGILECQARNREYYSTSEVDIIECELPWPDYGPFTRDNCSDVIAAVIDVNPDTSGTVEFLDKYYKAQNLCGSDPVVPTITYPAPCLSACCVDDVDPPQQISDADGRIPGGFHPLTNASEYDELKKLKLLHEVQSQDCLVSAAGQANPDSCPRDWMTLYTAGTYNSMGTKSVQMSEQNFNQKIMEKWDLDGTIIRRQCGPECADEYRDLYLKIYKKDAFASIYQSLLITFGLGQTPNVAFSTTDYKIFSTFENAVMDLSPWQAYYRGEVNQGFPGRSGIQVEGKAGQWNGQVVGGQANYMFSLYQGIRDWATTAGNHQHSTSGDTTGIQTITRDAGTAIAR